MQHHAHVELLARAGRVLDRLAHPRAATVLAVAAALTRSLDAYSPTTTRVPPSNITDDGTPFELSLRFAADGDVQFRCLWEAQAAPASASPGALWRAGARVNQLAGAWPGVDLAPLERVQDLFAPRSGAAPQFAMWHALSFDRAGRFLLKVYVNPAAAGDPLQTTLRALERLGQPATAALVEGIVRRRSRTSVRYFSVDLVDPAVARSKVYLAHAGVGLAELDAELARVPGQERGAATAAIAGLCGHAGAFTDLPILSCLAARAGDEAPAVTIHLPVRRYVASDAEVLAALTRRLPASQRALLERVLVDDLGMAAGDRRRFISYVSMPAGAAASELTVYLQTHFLAAPATASRATGS